jgi:KDO2-lipid IV(A) lauroyltransferase
MSMADTPEEAVNPAAGERLPLWLRALSRLPWSVLYGVGAGLAFIAQHGLRYRLSVVRANIEASFPELTPAEHRALERRYYRGLGELLAEVVKAATLERAELLQRVSLPNLEQLRAELDAGRSLLVVGAHHGNWEWMLLALSAQLGHPVDAAYKPLHGARGERLMHAIRTRFGATLVPAKELLAHTLRRRGPRALVMVADQEPVSSEHKWWTRFLGRPTAFYMGPEKIAQAARLSVMFAAVERTARGRYRVEFQPIAATRASSTPGAVTERYARLVEVQVRASPAQWTWSHRRWKLRRPVYGAGANALDQGSG